MEGGGFQELRPADAGAGAEFAPSGGSVETPRSGRLELAPRTSGQILDTALEIARGRFGLYVLAASALWVGVQALQPFLGVQNLENWMQGGSFELATALWTFNIWLQITVQQLSLVLVALLAWPGLFGRRVTAGAVAGRMLACLVPVLFLTPLLLGAIYFLGCCTLGVGSIYLVWKLTLVPCCYAIERAGIFGSVARSFRLTSHDGYGWEAFAGFLRWAAIAMTAYVVNLMFSMLGGLSGVVEVRRSMIESLGGAELLFDVLFVAVSSLLNGVGTALISVTLLAYYLDCRVRRDGLDLRGRLEALRAEWPSPPAVESTR